MIPSGMVKSIGDLDIATRQARNLTFTLRLSESLGSKSTVTVKVAFLGSGTEGMLNATTLRTCFRLRSIAWLLLVIEASESFCMRPICSRRSCSGRGRTGFDRPVTSPSGLLL